MEEFWEPPPPLCPMLELISLAPPTSLLAGLMDMAEEGVAGATPGELRPVPGQLPDSSRQSGEESPASCGWETSREEEQQLAWSESGSSLSQESNAGYFTLKLSI